MLDKLLNYGRALPYMRKDWWDLYNASKSSGGARIAYNWKNRKCGADIAWNSSFSGKPVFPHGITGVFISGDAQMGKDCVIFQQVTIGSNRTPGSKHWGTPIIGDNCYIGAGAKIIGNVKIGDNCRIGANAVVTKDVPSNSTVVLGEVIVIAHEPTLDTHYYSKNSDGKWIVFNNGKFELSEVQFKE